MLMNPEKINTNNNNPAFRRTHIDANELFKQFVSFQIDIGRFCYNNRNFARFAKNGDFSNSYCYDKRYS